MYPHRINPMVTDGDGDIETDPDDKADTEPGTETTVAVLSSSERGGDTVPDDERWNEVGVEGPQYADYDRNLSATMTPTPTRDE